MNKFWFGFIGIFIVLILLVVFGPIVVIGAGQRGVVFSNLSGVENNILDEGTHFRQPFVESVIPMSIQTQSTQFTESAGTKDSQQINVEFTVNWRLNPAKVNVIYNNIGDIDAVTNNVLFPNAKDSLKASISKYEALQIQQNRDNVSASALTLLQGKMARYNIFVDNLSITNIDFSATFNTAVEEAQAAQQQAKQAEYQVATAKAQAQANDLKQQSLTPAILEQLALQKWNGVLPAYLGNTSALPFFNIAGASASTSP